MTTNRLYTIYTAITLITSAACILSGTFVVGLLLYGVWVGSSVVWRRGEKRMDTYEKMTKEELVKIIRKQQENLLSAHVTLQCYKMNTEQIMGIFKEKQSLTYDGYKMIIEANKVAAGNA